MIYFIADPDNSFIESITLNPNIYVQKFEPIDVVDGRIIAWDEDGNVYHFTSAKNIPKIKSRKLISVVKVGEWDAQNDEPHMTMVGNDISALRKALILFLDEKSKNKWYHKLRNNRNSISEDNVNKPIKDLIELASHYITE